MKTSLTIVLAVIAFVASAVAESRSILIWLDRPEQGPSTATIYSDVENEKKKKINLADAALILKEAQGWGSTVLVFILSEQSIETNDYIVLLEGMKENGWLQLHSIEVSHGRSFSGWASNLHKRFVPDDPPITNP